MGKLRTRFFKKTNKTQTPVLPKYKKSIIAPHRLSVLFGKYLCPAR